MVRLAAPFRRLLLLSLVLIGLLAAPQLASAEGVYLGSKRVSYGTEKDAIDVPGGATYRAVRLCVAERGVNFYDLDFRFANGGHQDATVRLFIGPGECTRWIDLNGGARHVARIVMRYETHGSSGARAVVSAYGKK